MNYCPNCGRRTLKDANYCPVCGAELHSYVHIKREIELQKQEMHEEACVKEADLALFVEKNPNYYLKKWQKENSWNWSAFILAPFWLGYRKMYRVLLVLFGVIIVADAILRMVFGRIPGIPDLVAGFVTALFCGLRGNALYKKHAERQIVTVMENTQNETERVQGIRQIGGTSDSGIFYGLLVLLGYLIFFAYT